MSSQAHYHSEVIASAVEVMLQNTRYVIQKLVAASAAPSAASRPAASALHKTTSDRPTTTSKFTPSTMRILIAGATSHLASSLIPFLLKSPYISHIILLNRSSIRSAQILANDRITQLLYPDILSVPADVLRAHAPQAAIWLIGGSVGTFRTRTAAEDANINLPVRFLSLCLDAGIVPTPAGEGAAGAKVPFRFVYMSVRGAVQDGFARVWSDAANRKVKGAAEKGLLSLADERGQGMCEVYCLRLGKVLAGGQSVGNVIWEGMGGCLSEQLLNEKVLSLCLGGRGGEKYGAAEGSGVLELTEIMGEHWADINTVG